MGLRLVWGDACRFGLADTWMDWWTVKAVELAGSRHAVAGDVVVELELLELALPPFPARLRVWVGGGMVRLTGLEMPLVLGLMDFWLTSWLVGVGFADDDDDLLERWP